MKHLKLLTALVLLISNLLFSQSTKILDEKNGFMDLKIGNPISLYSDNVIVDEKEEGMYLVKDLSKYNMDERVINNIIIIVSKDEKKVIEHFTLYFTDRAKEYYQLSKSTALNYEKRIESLDMAKKILEQGTDIDYYYKLFKDAFGESTEKKPGGIEIWTGKKARLMYVNSGGDGNGLIDFSIVYPDEKVKKVKADKAKKASSKF